MVRVKDEHVVGVVDDAPAVAAEVPDQVDKGAKGTGRVEPRLTQDDDLLDLASLLLDLQILLR